MILENDLSENSKAWYMQVQTSISAFMPDVIFTFISDPHTLNCLRNCGVNDRQTIRMQEFLEDKFSGGKNQTYIGGRERSISGILQLQLAESVKECLEKIGADMSKSGPVIECARLALRKHTTNY